MAVFELRLVSKEDGSFAAAWFDDEACLWDDERLGWPTPLAADWQMPSLKLRRPSRGATAVLFNPNAIAVSEGVREELASFAELEFLPVLIEGSGVFHLIHVTAAIELPSGSTVRLAAPPSGNIVQLEAFPVGYEPKFSFFRVLQPPDSAARSRGATAPATYLSDKGAQAVQSCAHGYLAVLELACA